MRFRLRETIRTLRQRKTSRCRNVAVTLLFGMLGLAALPASAITFGEPDGNRHPNVGVVVVEVPPGFLDPAGGVLHACTGTLIHPRLFLTVGHCTDLLESFASVAGIGAVHVSFDQADALHPATWLAVTNIVTHPGYAPIPGLGSIPSSDVGVLVLRDPVAYPAPATLAPAGFLDAQKRAGRLDPTVQFAVVGYGTSLSFAPPRIIPLDGVRKVARSEYRALNKLWLTLSQNPALGNGGTGHHDSGGPTFWVEPDGREILVSITSRGDPKLVATGVTYRIDTADSLSFINSVIAGLPTQ
jgi:hypothetical protein